MLDIASATQPNVKQTYFGYIKLPLRAMQFNIIHCPRRPHNNDAKEGKCFNTTKYANWTRGTFPLFIRLLADNMFRLSFNNSQIINLEQEKNKEKKSGGKKEQFTSEITQLYYHIKWKLRDYYYLLLKIIIWKHSD